MATKATNPLDHTGHTVEQANKKNAAERSKRAEEISMLAAIEKQHLENNVFDPQSQIETVVIDEIEQVGVSLANENVIIRTQVDIEDMTFGVGNHYTFKAGVKYSVSKDLADYLEHLGYIWRP